MRAYIWIWSVSAVIYLLFWVWYNGIAGPLTEDEITKYSTVLGEREDLSNSSRAAVIQFMRTDDGDEFVMQNLVNFHKELVVHPDTKEKIPARKMLESYFLPFMYEMFKRAGHPVFTGSALSLNVEIWGVNSPIEWQAAGLIRYRSRRDLVELIVEPKFSNIHVYKNIALDSTFAFPVKPLQGFYSTPNSWVFLLLLNLSLIGHIITMYFRKASQHS